MKIKTCGKLLAKGKERGFNLAKRLKIPINIVKWEGQVADAIKKYIVWAAEIK